MRLARDLGKSMTEVMHFPVAEIGLWMAFYNIESEQSADDARTALLCAVTANSSGRYKKAFKPKDFMPKRKRTRKQSVEEQIMQFRKLTKDIKSK